MKGFYGNDSLVAMIRELTEMLRKNRTIDWIRRVTARAAIR
ncbi:MAG: type I restriction enzyme endonuclease domain-containing protein [Agathobacter sp.]